MTEAADMDRAYVRAATPTRVVLGGWPSPSFDRIVHFMRTLAPKTGVAKPLKVNPFSERLALPSDPSNVDFLRSQLGHDETHVLLIFIENLASVLARRIANGDPMAEAARDWQVVADRLLGLTEDEDPRIKVIATDEALRSPAKFSQFLSELFDWSLDHPNSIGSTALPKWHDFYLLIGLEYARQNRELHEITLNLESRRDFRPTNRPVEIDWPMVLNDVEAMRKENCVLVELLHKLQMDLERSVLKLRNQEDAVRELTRKEKAEAGAKNLLQNEHQLKQLKDQLTQTNRELALANDSLRAMQESTSWKLTKPLRGTSRLMKRLKSR